MTLMIWCNNDFSDDQEAERQLLIRSVGDHRLEFHSRAANDRAKALSALIVADVAFGFPDAQAVCESASLRWVQLNAAGYTSFDRDEIRSALIARGTIVTNSSDVYHEPCAQHLLAMITGLARGLPGALVAQRGDRSWGQFIRPTLPLLNGQTVLLLGFGSIARRLTELLRPLEMNLIALRRDARGDEPLRLITARQLDEALPTVDHLVNTLPANDQTVGFVNAELLAKLKPGAIVYNIGRGCTVNQDALIEALRSGHLAAAYLDVMDPEPLPKDHPLWDAPNCFITPHTGGGHRTEKERQVKHFLNNLRRFERGEPLVNRVF